MGFTGITAAILAIVVGIVLGGIFTLLKLPIPAPDNIDGILGIFGVFAGMVLVKYLVH